MRFVFDIDGVIMNLVKDNDYTKATPKMDVISLINSLFDYGHEIILFTARGSKTGIDWCEITKNQIDATGLKYHQLLFNKPYADYYIDDKLISIEELKHKLTKGNYYE